jgi:Uncharacterized protein conserved in bacteria (DUF2188)
MSKITYKVVKHDGGWAYEAKGTYSEPFPTRDAARKAAKLAASEQAAPGETTQISYEDEKGRWHRDCQKFCALSRLINGPRTDRRTPPRTGLLPQPIPLAASSNFS